MRIEWSPRALDDLSDILKYVVDTFGETAAYHVNNEINDEVDKLAFFPQLGRVYYHDTESGITYRALTSKYHIILNYSKGDDLKVVLLWNTRRDNNELTRQLKLIN